METLLDVIYSNNVGLKDSSDPQYENANIRLLPSLTPFEVREGADSVSTHFNQQPNRHRYS